ncbi:ATP-binding domain 1 family protein [Cryptosporidium andersoni]|uniref:GPN-loop GTPase 2 n=1 Tax=Cryptosporidium andersoni TaxID=117008 RepID=A0A1J4MK92_9CRYT|nr:ATP-binding domain 1 family protein [Cryptosporidium andersoni]
MAIFGQIVVGPPGAGKTTFINGMHQMCEALGRPHLVLNIDPANENIPYIPDIDIRDLITLDQIMEEYKLGPNGALIYAMEYLKVNVDWLIEEINKKKDKGRYLLIDIPGQVELYTHNISLKDILNDLFEMLDIRLTVIHLIDCTLLSSPTNYISSLLVSLSAQMSLELPYLNVFSKIDLLNTIRDDLPFRLEYFVEVQDLNQLLKYWENHSAQGNHPMALKFQLFQRELANLIEDSTIMQFIPVDINEKNSVLLLLQLIDKANGFSMLYEYVEYSALGLDDNPNMIPNEELIGTIQENLIDNILNIDE